MNRVDYVTMYQVFTLLQSPENDLDTLEIVAEHMGELVALAEMDRGARYGLIQDDTTHLHVMRSVELANELVAEFTPLCDDFLGISKSARAKLLTVMAEFLVSYGLMMFKSFGYEAIADSYATHKTVDISKIDLAPALLDDIAKDLSNAVDTLQTILVVFKQFGAYFAEYQIGDEDDINDIQARLEDQGLGTEAIASLSPDQVKKLLTQEEIK